MWFITHTPNPEIKKKLAELEYKVSHNARVRYKEQLGTKRQHWVLRRRECQNRVG